MKGQLLAALGIAMSTGSLVPALAVEPPHTNVFSPGVVVLAVACSANNTTSSIQVTNTKPTTFVKNSTVIWRTANGLQGSLQLASDLGSFKSISVPLAQKPGSSCTAAIQPAAK